MKIVLVVASGVYAGKEIAIAGTEFVIGRDEGCNLRPASPAISKRHCAVYYKEGQPHVRDLGSTNGTFLNDILVEGETPVAAGDKIRVGPLDFTVKFLGSRSDATPLPASLKSVTPGTPGAMRPVSPGTGGKSSAAVRPVPKTEGAGISPAAQGATGKSSAGVKPVPSNQVPSATSKPPVPPPAPKPAAKTVESGDDDIAAMLLGMSDDDGDPPEVPEGSTVMEMPAVDLDMFGNPVPPKPPEKKVITQEDSSSIARDLLSKMTRRPR